MNISMQLCLVLAACICLSESAPDGRLRPSSKQRPTRGFKNVEMMTARGFGKRDRPHSRAERLFETTPHKIFKPKNSLMVAYDFGKRSGNDNLDEVVDMDDFLENLASFPEKDPEAETVDSMPLDLLVMEMMNNPEFTRSVVRKFIDVNQDGMLSLEELLRNVA